MYYNHKNVEYARRLRKNMTPWERKLWFNFLSKYPVRFQRQKPVSEFIVDFFCSKANLIIELDGGGHYSPEQQENDEIRTRKLEEKGYKVVRFSNRDIDKNFYSVCTVIDQEVKSRVPPCLPL